MPSTFRQFKNFMREYAVSSVVVGIVTGVAVRDFAKAVVDDVAMPVLNLLLPNVNWNDWVVALSPVARLRVGHLLGAALDFLVICSLIFLFAKVATQAARK